MYKKVISLLSNDKPKKYLFLISHMRSRSSVLSHIFGSNPQINGYSELQMSYFNINSLEDMVEKIKLGGSYSKSKGFYFDKILHNHLSLCDEVIVNNNCKFIFMIRDPIETINSIYKMGSLTDVDWYTNLDKSLDYYCERLLEIETYSIKLKGQFFFIESDDLISKTELTLNNLTSWLGLKKKLKKKYKIFSHTGEPGYGDPSENIKKGVLQETSYNDMIKLPPEIINKAQISYDRCKLMLVENSFKN